MPRFDETSTSDKRAFLFMNTITHEQFIEKLNQKHPDREWKVLGKYEHNMTPILLEDKYGKCLIKPNSLLQHSRPSIKTAINKTDYTINRFKEVWGENMFDYSEFEYKGVRVKSTIICKVEGHKFLSDANNHLSKRGCPECAKEAISDRVKSNTGDFIEKAIKKYGNEKYSFEKTNYKTAIENVIITCKKHGDFEETPNRFLNGQICQKCSYKENSGSYYNLKKKTKKSIFYIIECFNEKERFIKLGVTARSVAKRFKDSYDMPYNYKIIREFEYPNLDTCDAIETQLLSFTKSAVYTPLIKFSGITEVRHISIKEPLVDLFDTFCDHLYHSAFFNFAEAYGGVFDLDILHSGNYSDLEINTVMKGYEVYKTLTSP